MQFTHSQRFQTSFNAKGFPFAALTLGSPAMVHDIDYSIFKKTMEEKMQIFTLKKQLGKTKGHKFNRVAIGDY